MRTVLLSIGVVAGLAALSAFELNELVWACECKCMEIEGDTAVDAAQSGDFEWDMTVWVATDCGGGQSLTVNIVTQTGPSWNVDIDSITPATQEVDGKGAEIPVHIVGDLRDADQDGGHWVEVYSWSDLQCDQTWLCNINSTT